MIDFEVTPEKEIWVKINSVTVLDETIVSQIEGRAANYIPGCHTLYINLKAIQTIESDAITALSRMAGKFMNSGCAIKYNSVHKNLDEIIGNLTISSD